MNNLSIDRTYGLLYKGMVYATGSEPINLRVSNKQAIDNQLAAEKEQIADWLDAYSVWCD